MELADSNVDREITDLNDDNQVIADQGREDERRISDFKNDEETYDSNYEEEEDLWYTTEDQETSDSDSEGEDIPCSCGDENHKNLEKWYKNYAIDRSTRIIYDSLDEAALNKLKEAAPDKCDEAALEASLDTLDGTALEEEIRKMLPLAPVFNSYCPACRKLLDEWPALMKKLEETPRYQRNYWTMPHFKDTVEFEAGYRNGCQLCANFIHCEHMASFDKWHKLQNRLKCLGKSTVISVHIFKQFVKDKDCLLLLTWPEGSYGTRVTLKCSKNHDSRMIQTPHIG